MASFNRVILVGNLTRDPQVKYTPSGMAVSEIGLAVGRVWNDRQTGQKREETTFVDVTLWGRQAEIAGEYLAKGRPVLIEGRLQLDQWEDKQTQQKRSKLRVVGETMQLLGSRNEGSGGRPGGGGAPSFDSGPPASMDGGPSFEPDMMGGPPSDDIPF